jgi:hypothetical protein
MTDYRTATVFFDESCERFEQVAGVITYEIRTGVLVVFSKRDINDPHSEQVVNGFKNYSSFVIDFD